MSLKDLTWDKHQEAEKTPFMQAVFKGTMTKEIWTDYTYNKMLWYGAIETKASAEGLSDDLPDLGRTYKLYQDFKEMNDSNSAYIWRDIAGKYHRYILDLEPGLVLAHLYVWHMGDLYGGQMIKKVLPFSHRNLEFKDADKLKESIRNKLNDSLGEEANRAFDWAIRILHEYDNSFNT
jgi:heme oxygenase